MKGVAHELFHGAVEELAGVGALDEDGYPGILDFFWLASLQGTFGPCIFGFSVAHNTQ